MKSIKKEKQKVKGLHDKKRIYVLDFDGDMRASGVDNLRDEISVLLGMVRPDKDEAVIRLESSGGIVHAYGLAASQLARFRRAGVHLTVCIDEVAASGGYLMACTGNKILAAPFAIIGSIGVVASIPNFHRVLARHDVDFEELTAGKYKRTMSVFGENTDEGRIKFKEELEDTHSLFKSFVLRYRPDLPIDKVATGEHWYGDRALALNLVDEIATSDDYLISQCGKADVFSVKISGRKNLSERLRDNIAVGLTQVCERLFPLFYVR
jgi:serine protease SohB